MEARLSHALKEWDVTVNALEKGKTILLLRKGGIRESQGNFKIQYNPVLLYPTYEHQKPDLLQPDYASLVKSVSLGWHPEMISIGSWAEITDVFKLKNLLIIKELFPDHIWTNNFVEERLKWKSNQPLFILLLRVYLFSEAVIIPYQSTYGGCRSWIKLEASIPLKESKVVIEDNKYYQITARIRQIIKRS
ncbi:MAG: DUF1802 family protein [Crocosphaera sp.]|nr:DUF1802 family protein [Crocosphaera sp.]